MVNKVVLSLVLTLASLAAVSGLSHVAIAEIQTTDLTPIGSNIAIEKSSVTLSVPENNSLPWAFIEGTVSNPVPDYPVIIQIYDMAGDPVHFAQVEVNHDGSYEYRFRVLDSSNGLQTHIFEGEYTVKIFKTVYLDDDLGAI